MATAIRFTPILKGKVAKRFNDIADSNLEKKHSIDFSKEASNARKILKKSKL